MGFGQSFAKTFVPVYQQQVANRAQLEMARSQQNYNRLVGATSALASIPDNGSPENQKRRAFFQAIIDQSAEDGANVGQGRGLLGLLTNNKLTRGLAGGVGGALNPSMTFKQGYDEGYHSEGASPSGVFNVIKNPKSYTVPASSDVSTQTNWGSQPQDELSQILEGSGIDPSSITTSQKFSLNRRLPQINTIQDPMVRKIVVNEALNPVTSDTEFAALLDKHRPSSTVQDSINFLTEARALGDTLKATSKQSPGAIGLLSGLAAPVGNVLGVLPKPLATRLGLEQLRSGVFSKERKAAGAGAALNAGELRLIEAALPSLNTADPGAFNDAVNRYNALVNQRIDRLRSQYGSQGIDLGDVSNPEYINQDFTNQEFLKNTQGHFNPNVPIIGLGLGGGAIASNAVSSIAKTGTGMNLTSKIASGVLNTAKNPASLLKVPGGVPTALGLGALAGIPVGNFASGQIANKLVDNAIKTKHITKNSDGTLNIDLGMIGDIYKLNSKKGTDKIQELTTDQAQSKLRLIPSASAAMIEEQSQIEPKIIQAVDKVSSEYNIDPYMLLAIGQHETKWGKLGEGKKGMYTGYAAYDRGSDYSKSGLEKQLKGTAKKLSQWGLTRDNTNIETLAKGNAGLLPSGIYATDKAWPGKVWRHYLFFKKLGQIGEGK